MANLIIPDGGNIGSSSDTDAISISSGGNVTLSQTLDGGAIGSAVTMSANQPAVKTALNASGSAPIYACRAWVNFNGTGTVAIRGSGNVSSITDNGTGYYTINCTTAMPDVNYSVCVSGMGSDDNRYTGISQTSSMTTSTVRVYGHYHADGSYQDMQVMCVSIFR
tara:strand:- start:2244 stop:2738 length:495 start_codon:yes stop_codon:yes gene_type:complete